MEAILGARPEIDMRPVPQYAWSGLNGQRIEALRQLDRGAENNKDYLNVLASSADLHAVSSFHRQDLAPFVFRASVVHPDAAPTDTIAYRDPDHGVVEVRSLMRTRAVVSRVQGQDGPRCARTKSRLRMGWMFWEAPFPDHEREFKVVRGCVVANFPSDFSHGPLASVADVGTRDRGVSPRFLELLKIVGGNEVRAMILKKMREEERVAAAARAAVGGGA